MFAFSNSDIAAAISHSRASESDIYTTNIREFFTNARVAAGELYDTVASETDNFQYLTAEYIQENPPSIYLLRHLLCPSVSQKKLKSAIDSKSIKSYEDGKTTPDYETAQAIAEYVQERIDPERVPWHHTLEGNTRETTPTERQQAVSRTTVTTFMGETRADTLYRNWRMKVQEGKVEEVLLQAGYTKRTDIGSFTASGQLEVGEFVDETKVVEGDSHKADFILKIPSGQVVFIEAKACGINTDGFKRMSEIRAKATDWTAEFPESRAVAVVAGEFDKRCVRNLLEAGIHVCWEHMLDRLGQELLLEAQDTIDGESVTAIDPEQKIGIATQPRKNVRLSDYIADSD